MYRLHLVAKQLFSSQVRNVTRRGLQRAGIHLELNERVGDFVLREVKETGTLDCKMYRFEHPSGVRYYHLDSPSILNTCGIMVNNSPKDDKGVPYIVEKMIQCGDNKYKVKDAIESMKNRSFNEVGGSQTTEDYFLFPFQTKSIPDFKNLLDVYLNMIFNPRMEESDFIESRGHFSFANGSPSSYLMIDGGVYSESFLNEQLLEPQINRIIRKNFINQEYSVIGKSNNVITASYQDSLLYYQNTFNLSNSVFYTHGDINPVRHIELFTQFINQSKRLWKPEQKPLPSIQQLSKSPINLPQTVRLYHCEGETQTNQFILSFKLPPTLSPSQKIQINVLSCILFDFPQSPFNKYLSQSTPYPKMYGYRDICFNVGYSTSDQITDFSTVQSQKMLLNDLSAIVRDGIEDGFIEAVLNNLQSSYYTNNGLTILQHISTQLSQNTEFASKLDISSIFENIKLNYRKKNIFQNLISKYLLNNNQYLRIICEYDKNLMEKLRVRNQYKCIEHKKTLSPEQMSNICNYTPNQEIQNVGNLPIINSNDYQILEESNKRQKQINSVPVTFVEGERLAQVVFKIDITDIDEEHLNMVELYKNILPRLGSQNTLNINYDEFIEKYLSGIEMELLTTKSDSRDGLKLFLLFKVSFLSQNVQYAFNLLNNSLNHPNFDNLARISEIIMAESSRIYSSISEEPLLYGCSYVSSQFNPFLKLEDKLFHARSFSSVASDIIKVANSKHILEYVSSNMKRMHSKIQETRRYSVYVEGPPELQSQMDRYLEILLDTKPGNQVEAIDIQGFMPSKIRTYFPNFKQGMVFEGFQVPYLEKESPALTLLGSIIHSNIQKHKRIGGCYTYKGGLVSYLSGGLKEFLELEKFYQDINEVETGKRRLFQRFNSHTVYQEFKYNFGKHFVKHYKQAILATELSDIRHVLHKYIFQPLKEEQNSQVMMGPHLADYAPLMKTSWTIERILEDMSLSMEGSQIAQPQRLLTFNRLDIV